MLKIFLKSLLNSYLVTLCDTESVFGLMGGLGSSLLHDRLQIGRPSRVLQNGCGGCDALVETVLRTELARCEGSTLV